MIRVPFRFAALLAAAAATPAQAVCDAANTYGFLYANQPATTLAYGSTYAYTAATSGGATRPFTVAITANGITNNTPNGVTLPAIGTLITGPDATKRDLVIGGTFSGRTGNIDGTTRVITVTFTFAQPIRDFAVTLHDVDFSANQYRDLVQITGTAGGTVFTPAMTSPAGNSNATGGSKTNANSSLSFGPVTTPVTITASQAVGIRMSENNTDTGTVTASFVQPVTSVTIKYGNAPLTSGESVTGQQATGIAGISFCPMPAIAMTKTSTAVISALGGYDLPGNDTVYELTVTNSGGSPVDASTIVLSDVLPAAVTFRNLAYDGATTTNYSFTANGSGVAMAANRVGYSNNGGTSYAYTPTSGYDAAVSAVRFSPTGTMAANSSFTIRFKAQIK